jgi:hypothetical protein
MDPEKAASDDAKSGPERVWKGLKSVGFRWRGPLREEEGREISLPQAARNAEVPEGRRGKFKRARYPVWSNRSFK